MKGPLSFLLTCLTVIVAGNSLSGQVTYVFLGSFNRDRAKDGIYVYALDTTSGKLTRVAAANGVRNPSYLALSPGGRVVYACTDSKTPGAGSVSSFAFDPQHHTLTFLNSRSSGGENPVYLTVDKSGKWLVNANYTEGGISVFPLGEDGTIGPMAQLVRHAGSSVHKDRQDRSHVHACVFPPGSDHVLSADLGADQVRCYVFDSACDEPLQTCEAVSVNCVPGSGPRHIRFHPNGKFAYCIEELSGTVSAYTYENGQLHGLQRTNTHPADVVSGYESADIQISPDGKFLYASNRGMENNIAVFSIGDEGTLQPVAYTPAGGTHPRNFSIDPTGRFLIVANVVSENVVVFKRDPATGCLQQTGYEAGIPHVTSVLIKQYR